MCKAVQEFEDIVNRLQQRMTCCIWRMLRDPDAVEDVMQDALVRIWRQFEKVRIHPNPPALVLRMCHQVVLDHLRRQKQSAVEKTGMSLTDRSGDFNGPLGIMMHDEELKRVLLEIKSLPARQAEALTLKALEGLSYRDIALAMACKESTVRQLIHKARRRLIQQIPEYLRENVPESKS